MTSWPDEKIRDAKSLEILRQQVDQLAPDRDKGSDGTRAGKAHHIANPKSDHEPWVKNGDWHIVTAIDITHDPADGCDAHALADLMRDRKDTRLKYIISNRRIWNPGISDAWRSYNGSNPHDQHAHFSMKPEARLYDDSTPFDLSGWGAAVPIEEQRKPVLRRGAEGPFVKYLQRLLGMKDAEIDGLFGRGTERMVMAFQRAREIVDDGIVGPYTWRALEARPAQVPSRKGWNTDITATVFGGDVDVGEQSAYDGHVISNTEMCVALPWSFVGKRPRVQLENAADTSKSASATIEDKGPWLLNDNYFLTGNRPLAEVAHQAGARLQSGPNKGRVPSNSAGIDLSPALAKALGIRGIGKVNFRLV